MKRSFPQQYLKPEREENFSEFCLKKEVDQITVVTTFVIFFKTTALSDFSQNLRFNNIILMYVTGVPRQQG